MIGTPAFYSHLRLFGCSTFFHVNDDKLEPRERKDIFLGYATGIKGYRLWCSGPKSPKFVISRDVTFDKNFILQPRIESIIDSKSLGEKASKQLKLESKASEAV